MTTKIHWPSDGMLSAALATDAGRQNLTRLSVEPHDSQGQALCVATNGRALAVRPVRISGDPLTQPCRIPRGAVEQIESLVQREAEQAREDWRGARPKPTIVELSDSHVGFGDGALKIEVRLDSAEYVNWRAVVPSPFQGEGDTRVRLTLNAHVLASVQDALGCEGLLLTFGSDPLNRSDPIRIDALHGDRTGDGWGAVMPIVNHNSLRAAFEPTPEPTKGAARSNTTVQLRTCAGQTEADVGTIVSDGFPRAASIAEFLEALAHGARLENTSPDEWEHFRELLMQRGGS